MYRHVILFKSEKPSAIEKICQHVMSIKDEIPNLLDVTYIENLTDNAKGYNQMAIMEFKKRKDFVGWREHPYHQQAVEQLKEIADTIFFDYEC